MFAHDLTYWSLKSQLVIDKNQMLDLEKVTYCPRQFAPPKRQISSGQDPLLQSPSSCVHWIPLQRITVSIILCVQLGAYTILQMKGRSDA